MSKKIFSLVVQDEYLKVLSLKRSKVSSYGLTKLSPGAVFNDKITRTQRVADELESLLKSARPKKIRARYAVVEVSDAQSFIKPLKIPGIKEEEVAEALKWQLEKILPLPPSKVYWDWKLVASSKEGVEILLIAAPREVIDAIIDVLNIKEITVKAIEPRSVALAKILATGKSPSLIVDLGFQKATIVIGKNGLPYFSTTESIDNTLTGAKKAVEQAIKFYQKESGEKIKDILICGDQKVNECYSLFDKSFKGFDIKKVQLELKAPESFKKVSSGFVANIGLLAKENVFNLLPESLKEQFKINKINDTINRLVLYFALFALLIIALFGLTWLRLIMDLRNTEVALANVSKTAPVDLVALENKAKNVNQQAQRINTLFSLPSKDVTSLLKAVNQAVPSNVVINNILVNYSDKSLKITGFAPGREQIILFRDNLRKVSQIENVSVPLSSLERPQDISFTLNCSLK